MRIIPAIDIIDGKCVRLTKGDYTTKKIYNESTLARKREKQLKNWHKEWKWNLIRKSNPDLKILEIE